MKLIKSIVRPNKVDDVRAALEAIGVPGMTVTEVRGHGRQKGHTEAYRGHEYKIDLLPKIKVEMVVPSERAAEVVQVLTTAARTGKIGDGKIFVLPAEQVFRIRTGERGPDAI